MPTLEEFDDFVKQLGNHDWTFEYSDDQSKWRSGKAKQSSLLNQTRKNTFFDKAYIAYLDYTYGDSIEPMTWPDRLIKRANTITELRQQICVDMTNKLLLNAA